MAHVRSSFSPPPPVHTTPLLHSPRQDLVHARALLRVPPRGDGVRVHPHRQMAMVVCRRHAPARGGGGQPTAEEDPQEGGGGAGGGLAGLLLLLVVVGEEMMWRVFCVAAGVMGVWAEALTAGA